MCGSKKSHTHIKIQTNISNSTFHNNGSYQAYDDSIIEDYDQYTSFPRPPTLPVWRHIKNSFESKSNGFYLLFNPPSIKCSQSLSLSSLLIILSISLHGPDSTNLLQYYDLCIHLQSTASTQNDLCQEKHFQKYRLWENVMLNQ